jgi:hypothetical protein
VTVVQVDHWLRTAERVRFPLRRVSGGRCVVILGRLPRGSYQLAIDTGAPGHHGISRCLPDDVVFANRHNALTAGLREVREYWRSRFVPAMVDDVDELIEGLWE